MRVTSQRKLRIDEILAVLDRPRTTVQVQALLGGAERVAFSTVQRMLRIAENGTWVVRKREGYADAWERTEHGEQRLSMRRRAG